jgi:pilus assembly protein Flp/PilA
MMTVAEFLTDESGATAIEYGLIAAGISVAIIAVVNALGTQLQTTFSTVSSQRRPASNARTRGGLPPAVALRAAREGRSGRSSRPNLSSASS